MQHVYDHIMHVMIYIYRVLVRELREKLDLLLLCKITTPDLDINDSPLIDAITRLLMTDGL